ncbi:MAG: hypothetical protein KA383_04350 [Phycisphaerae bacterium]|nr:hypothetical protein [Phycisphaerae bacterium]
MMPAGLISRLMIAALLLFTSTAATRAADVADKFYRAYYLERDQRDYAGAAKLYAEVVQAKGAEANLQAAARVRLASCREELATTDFARLMPPNVLGYVELNRPGERVRKLLDQLGLLAKDGQKPVVGQNRLAISPALVDAVLGMRGAALAVTGFDPSAQRPSGVAVLHPGDMDVVRGLIETGLPAGASVVEPIAGYATYELEDVYITLTSRLVIAGSSPIEIEGVLDRMKDDQAESLATDPQLADVLKDRRGELLFFCVNPKPLLPLMDVMMAAGASQSREFAIAQGLLDPKSFRALTGRLDLSDEGFVLEVTLRLDEGHRNLVYNFLRRPAIDRETLRSVPSGAAALLALAMNEAPTKYGDVPPGQPATPPVVTALDLGREVFANINGVAVYVLPPTAGAPSKDVVPDIVAAITVNDPAKSQALWTEMLGIASLASGGPTIEGEPRQVGGVAARSYRFEKGVTVYVTTVGHRLLIASNEQALARALEPVRGGKSILDDADFAAPLSHVGPQTTLAVLAHAARCAAIARPFMPPDEAAELEPIIATLTNTAALVTVDHSDRLLRCSAAVTGVPNIGNLVNQKLTEERQRQTGDRELTRAMKGRDPGRALTLLDRRLARSPADAGLLRKKFDVLATGQKDHAAALVAAEGLCAALNDDADELNSFAWALLTEEQYGKEYTEVALHAARRSNELTKHENWAYLDTLALAEFETGNVEQAIALEKKAIELSKQRNGGAGLADMEKALKRFESATAGSARAEAAGPN